jgi:hypothetical protein
MEEGNLLDGGVLVITKFEQIAPQLAEILRFVSTEAARETARRAVQLRRRMAATTDEAYEDEDPSIGELCLLRQLQSIADACQLALECAEGQNLIAKSTSQAALGMVAGWHELEKQREAAGRQQRQRKKK